MRKFLKKFKKFNNDENRHNFCVSRREYKHLLHRKKKAFNDSMIQKLIDAIHDQKLFWESVYKICPKRLYVKNEIKVDDWFRHFKTLLEQDDLLAGQANEEGWEDENDQFFNRPISQEEILLALRNLKPKKAAGPDCIIGEILKHSGPYIVPFFLRFFNTLFDNGIYPNQWTESIIQPLYKKGDANNPGNYRGISLSDTSSKIYGMIINRRIQNWVD